MKQVSALVIRTHSWDRTHEIFTILCGTSKVRGAGHGPTVVWGGPHFHCPVSPSGPCHHLEVFSVSHLEPPDFRPQMFSLSPLLLRTQSKSTDPLCFNSFLPSLDSASYQVDLGCSAPSQLFLPTPALPTTNIHPPKTPLHPTLGTRSTAKSASTLPNIQLH